MLSRNLVKKFHLTFADQFKTLYGTLVIYLDSQNGALYLKQELGVFTVQYQKRGQDTQEEIEVTDSTIDSVLSKIYEG